MTLRDIRVRKKLHELDTSRASYPTVARTGDINRRGKFKLTFDDTNTIVFKSDAAISYPTTLEVGSPYLDSDLQSSISIEASGSINENAIDPWIQREYEAEGYQGFKEDNLFEQAANADVRFYQTGSAIEDVGDGFQSSLLNKTVIRLELPITGVTTLDPLSASSYYYDFRTKKFEQVQIHAYSLNDFGTQDSSLGPGNSAIPPLSRQNLLFNPVGKHTTNLSITGYYTFNAPATLPDFFFNSDFDDNLKSSATSAAVTQTLDLSNIINQPFLLEKCVIKIPFMAGPGWFRDMTHWSWTAWGDFDPYWGIDFGGPGLTFAIFNQFADNSKDLVLSATIIPERDNTRQLTKVYSFFQATTGETTPYAETTMPQGFKSFSEPTLVVKQPEDANFTGSITLETIPQISVGMTAMERFGPQFPNPVRTLVPFVQSLAGRGKSKGIENLTGRSIFGRASNAPDIEAPYQINGDLYAASGSTDERFYQIETHAKSPYLLFPKDKLFFSLSKWRSAFVSESFDPGYYILGGAPLGPDPTYLDKGHGTPVVTDQSYSGLTQGPVYYYQSSSHDVQINEGTFSITLYGSLVKEGKEYHNTLNTRLDTNSVHEMIGAEPVVDEFDVFYESELTGSYNKQLKLFNEVPYLLKGKQPNGSITTTGFAVTGSIQDATVFSHVSSENPLPRGFYTGSWSTQYNFLRPRHLSEARKSMRNVSLISKELFWDTRLPDPKQVSLMANPDFRLDGLDAADGSSYYRTMYTGLTSTLGSTGVGIRDWMMTYPYEAKYNSVSYQFFDSLNGDIFRYKNPGVPVSTLPAFFRYENINIEVGDTNTRYVAGEPLKVADANIVGLGYSEFVKVFYGAGDGRSRVDNRHVKFRFNPNSAANPGYNWASAILRGWRHGMISGFPLYTTAIFRRDRFGQMRDMLEQRLDTKFFNNGELGPNLGVLDAAVTVKFVDSTGNTVKPYETMSSNLSLECTSSLPYFDGSVRNREEPITFAKTNQSLVIV